MSTFWRYMRKVVSKLPSGAKLNHGVKRCVEPRRDRYRQYPCAHGRVQDVANLDDLEGFDDDNLNPDDACIEISD
jgi:hypothetical protein